jgi:predicted phage terminase large subunit-like protein
MGSEHSDQKILEAVLRVDCASFIAKAFGTVSPGVPFMPNWHIRAIAYQLERVARGEVRRLLITMPPRSLKSISASVAFPAYLLGHDPSKRIVCLSYAEELAEKHARDCRAVMESAWYRSIFPAARLSRRRSAELDFETTKRGGRLSTSVGGTFTGRGGSLIVIDDPQKPTDAMSEKKRASTLDWFRNTLPTRLDDQRNDAIVVVMQRLHVADVAAYLLENDGWTHLNLPAIAIDDANIEIGAGRFHHRKAGELLHPERMPREELDRLKAEMGTFHFEAQLQQNPVPERGNLVQAKWFGAYLTPPSAKAGGRIVQSWDFAVKDGEQNDWTVCITAHVKGNTVHILDVFRERLDYPGQRRAVVHLARKYSTNVVLIEAAASGSPLVADLRQLAAEGVPSPIPILPLGSKVERFSVQSHRIEAGDVYLPERALWRGDFLAEVLSFPFGRYDDQVDALSQLLAWVDRDQKRSSTTICGPRYYVEGRGWFP